MIERDGITFIEVGDIIEKQPTVLYKPEKGPVITKGRVEYIHPEGRYYEVRFTSILGEGSFLESFFFTNEELENAYELGIFPRRLVERLDVLRPSVKSGGGGFHVKDVSDLMALF